MNLDDLRRELRTRAAEPDPTSMPDRLAGVRTKVVARRRRKAAATGVAALASLSVVGVGAGQVLTDDRSDEAAFVPLPDQLNGDWLIAAEYNETGASELSWQVSLDDYHVVTQVTCQIPTDAALPDPEAPVLMQVSVNGQPQFAPQCGPPEPASIRQDGPAVRSDWRDLGIRKNEEFELEAWLIQGGERVEVPDAQFGVGLYKKTGDRIRLHGVELPELVDVDGDSYRLGDSKIRPLSEGRRIRLPVPASSSPVAVTYGWQSEQPAASYELLQDGEPLEDGYGGPIEGPELFEFDSAPTLTLRANGSSADGVLVLAYYELDD